MGERGRETAPFSLPVVPHASAKESVLVVYVPIGNESRRLQNSQLNGMGNEKLATSFSW